MSMPKNILKDMGKEGNCQLRGSRETGLGDGSNEVAGDFACRDQGMRLPCKPIR
jgi:hypothetical protein